MVAVRLTFFVSLACLFACASGIEPPYGGSVDDVDDHYDGPPKIVRRFDAGPGDVGELADDEEVESDAGAWLTLEDGGLLDDPGDAQVEPALSSQSATTPAAARETGLDAGSASAAQRCRAGAYTGVFSGEVRALLGTVRVDVSGTVRFQLPAATGAHLALQNGALEGRDKEGHPIRASLSGTVDCASGQLETGRLRDGTYTRPDPLMRGRTVTERFSGVVTGVFTGDPPTARGSFGIDNERSARTGSGSWSVSLTP